MIRTKRKVDLSQSRAVGTLVIAARRLNQGRTRRENSSLTSKIDFRVNVLDEIFVKAAFDISLQEENLSG